MKHAISRRIRPQLIDRASLASTRGGAGGYKSAEEQQDTARQGTVAMETITITYEKIDML